MAVKKEYQILRGLKMGYFLLIERFIAIFHFIQLAQLGSKIKIQLNIKINYSKEW